MLNFRQLVTDIVKKLMNFFSQRMLPFIILKKNHKTFSQVTPVSKK